MKLVTYILFSLIVCAKMVAIEPAPFDAIEVERTIHRAYAETDESNFLAADEQLHKAILNDSADEITLALQAGASLESGKDGKPPLLYAVLLQKIKCCCCTAAAWRQSQAKIQWKKSGIGFYATWGCKVCNTPCQSRL